MLKLGTVRFKARCTRHPSFNPLLDGEVAIKGGCPKCHLLMDIFYAHQKLVRLMHQAKPDAERRKNEEAAAAENQLPLFQG